MLEISTLKLNEKIKRFEKYLIEQKNQELQKISLALENCQNCHNSRDWYICLCRQNLTYRQIGILEGISKQKIGQILQK